MASTTPVTETTEQGFLALLAHLAHVSRRDIDAALAGVDGLRPRLLVAMRLLRDHGPLAQGALGEALRLDPSNVVGLLNDLEARGLVTRQRDPADRRRHIVELSDAGRQTLARAEASLATVEERTLRGLSPEERCTLHDLLLRAAGGAMPDCTEAAALDDEGGC